MAENRLTKLQSETLALIADGKIYQLKHGYAAWRIHGGTPSTVGRLISMGLAKWGPHGDGRIDCLVTDAGLAALNKGDRT